MLRFMTRRNEHAAIDAFSVHHTPFPSFVSGRDLHPLGDAAVVWVGRQIDGCRCAHENRFLNSAILGRDDLPHDALRRYEHPARLGPVSRRNEIVGREARLDEHGFLHRNDLGRAFDRLVAGDGSSFPGKAWRDGEGEAAAGRQQGY